MPDEPMKVRDEIATDDLEAEETARLIDALMAGPPARLPSIIVVGDEAVFGITPAARSR